MEIDGAQRGPAVAGVGEAEVPVGEQPENRLVEVVHVLLAHLDREAIP